ncbi:MAG: MFS transporter [Acidimicrobiales bacterium]|jgi:DHA1 family inner membrane transport protein
MDDAVAGSPLAVPEFLRARRPLAAVGALAALGGSAFCFVTGESLPVGLLPELSASLHSSLSATGLLVTAYALVSVVASAPLTHLTRHVPRRSLLSGLLGVFVVATLGAAAAPDYWLLMAARIVTALSQAVFWSIAPVTAAGLFPPAKRGRAIAGVLASGPIAILLGVPAGTWIGLQAGWRVPFVVLSGLGLAGIVAVVLLIPPTKPSESRVAAGSHPDARRFWMGAVAMVLAVSATFTAYTYITAFLTRVSGIPEGDVPAVLLLSGLGALLGVVGTALVVSRRPRVGAVGPVGLLVVSLFGLYFFGTTGAAVAGLQALESFGLAGADILLLTRVLVVAPRSTDIASAWYSASYNAGIASGPVIGGLVLSGLGLRSTPLVGGFLAVLALAVVLSERFLGGSA